MKYLFCLIKRAQKEMIKYRAKININRSYKYIRLV